MEELKILGVAILFVITFFAGRWSGYEEGCKDNKYKFMLHTFMEGLEACSIEDEDKRKEAMKEVEEKCKNPYAFMKR